MADRLDFVPDSKKFRGISSAEKIKGGNFYEPEKQIKKNCQRVHSCSYVHDDAP